MIERRALLRAAGLAVLGAPVVAGAQAAGPARRIGFLGGASAAGYTALVEAMLQRLQDHGWVNGKNVTIEYRWADGKYERLPALAAELIRVKADVIVTQGTPAALAAKQATSTTPIVMAIVGNPVETGIVASMARPGGNVTGSSFFMAEVNAKRLELMKVLIPRLARAGVLVNPDNPAMTSLLRAIEETGRTLNVKVQPVNVRLLDDLDRALKVARTQVEALTIVDDGLFVANARRIAELAVRNRLATIGFREYCDAGGLLSYGVDFPYMWRQSADLIDKVLRGAKPADLPILQAARFQMVINLKTAKALALTIPSSVLARADEVIN